MNLTALDVPRKGKVQNIKAPLDLRRKKSCSGTEAPWTLSDGPYGRGPTVLIVKKNTVIQYASCPASFENTRDVSRMSGFPEQAIVGN